jgi:hypothetical protein
MTDDSERIQDTMPAATMTTSSIFTGFDERRYNLRIVGAKPSTSPQDNRPQHEFELALEGTEDPEKGGEVVRRMWTSTAWNESAEKTSHQVLLARALCGPAVTLEQWEAIDYPDMLGMRFSAFVKLDAKGWPSVDKESIKAAATKAAPALPITSATALASPPTTPPARPVPPPVRKPAVALRTNDQLGRLFEAGLALTDPLDEAALADWAVTSYGHGLDALTPPECEELIAALGGPGF